MTRATRASAAITSTWLTRAGDRAFPTNSAGSSDQSTMSIFSPCSSCMTLRARPPIGPMQAPLALTPGLRGGALGAVIGELQCFLDRLDHEFERDVLFSLETAQSRHIDVHEASP